MDQHDNTAPADAGLSIDELAAVQRGLEDMEAGRVYKLETVLTWFDKLDRDPATPEPDYD